MTLPILKIGDKTLKKKAKRVPNVDDAIRTLCASMVSTMYENNGIGLAAPQVGVLKQIIVVDKGNKEALILINPEIIFESEEKVSMEEGCLSIPEKFDYVTRPETISVKFRDTKGRAHFNTYDGLIARVIQHEIDHLYGKLFVEYLEKSIATPE
jgi:peptide deformylase